MLVVGMLVALAMLGQGAGGAYRANMAGGNDVEGFLLTTFSFLVMGAVVISPYVFLAFLGNRITGDGSVSRYRVAGLVISFLVTGASLFIYADAYYVASHSRSSTAGLVVLAVPVYLILVGGGLYGVVVFLFKRARRQQGA